MKNTLKKLATKTLMAAPFILPSLGLAQQPVQHNNYTTLAPVVVDSTDYKNKLATYDLDDYYYMDDLIQRQMIADGIKNPTRDTYVRYAKKIHQNALKGAPSLDHIVGMGVRNLGDGKKEIVYFMNESRTKTVSLDNMRTDLNYTLAEVNAAAQQIPIYLDDCDDCDDDLVLQENNKKLNLNKGFNFFDNLVVGYTHNFPAQSNESEFSGNYGGNIHLGVPVSEKLNLELAYTLNAENNAQGNERIVNESVQTNSGRIFEDVTYKGFSVESNAIGKVGLSYDFNPRGMVPVTLGLGANITSLLVNQYEDNKQEAFFDENNDGIIDLETEFVGEGTLPEQYVTPAGDAEKLVGADAFIQVGLPQTGLRFRLGGSYTPKSDISFDANGNMTRGNQTLLYGGLTFTFGNWGRK